MRPLNPKPRGRWLLPLFAMMAAVALAVLTAPKPALPTLVRYVGPPLKDGSRVTFLHPTSVNVLLVSQISKSLQPWVVQYVQTTRQGDAVKSIFHRIPVLSQVWERVYPPELLSESVVVSTIDDTKSSQGKVQDGRTEMPFISAEQTGPARMYGDNIDVVRKSPALEYQFQYLHCGISSHAVTKKYEAAIVNSFQVLPPGAAVPTP